jgi:hypothetical protein
VQTTTETGTAAANAQFAFTISDAVTVDPSPNQTTSPKAG